MIYYEDKLNEPPRVLKGVTAYRNDREEYVSYLLADYLKASELVREESTISFWDGKKGAYIFGFNVTKDVKDIRRNIATRFLADNTVRRPPRS